MAESKRLTVLQTLKPPMVDLNEVRDHAAAVKLLIQWERVGLLFDDQLSNVILVLEYQEDLVGVVRFCLSIEESVEAVLAYQSRTDDLELRCLQGRSITADELVDLKRLTTVWQESDSQSVAVSIDEITKFFQRLENRARSKGRGRDISADTRRQVWFDAHGRCMFEGCGIDLTLDPVTGQRGNFAYLAHNIASSESGTRGVLYLSGLLADDPRNVLLLCDTHHRLVDVVAKADYPVARLSKMRAQFCRDADGLLEGLSKTPIQAYCLTWPVHQQVISAPSPLQIAQALDPIGARLDGQLNMLNDYDALFRSSQPDNLWSQIPTIINATADRILMQAQTKAYRAALFAMGLMPSLIALGAKLGNKCEITPMLRFRENGLWYWPAKDPHGQFYKIEGLEKLSDHEGEVSLQLALTANPEAMNFTVKSLGYRCVTVIAHSSLMGNGALGHPVDGYSFRQQMQELLHMLRDKHGVDRVHLLPCASNAACVFFGQAFDSYHPELVIYDFEPKGDHMVPRLRVHNIDNGCSIEQA